MHDVALLLSSLLLSTSTFVPSALANPSTELVQPIEVFEADGDEFQGAPRAWLVDRSPAVLDPSEVPEPEDTTSWAENYR